MSLENLSSEVTLCYIFIFEKLFHYGASERANLNVRLDLSDPAVVSHGQRSWQKQATRLKSIT